MFAFALSASTVALLLAPAQEPPVVARFQWDGRDLAVSRAELGLELARRYRRTDRGREAVEHLVDTRLVEDAARDRGLLPTSAEIDARLRELRRRLQGRGMNLDRFLDERGMTVEQFEAQVGLSIAHERLVMASLDLGSVAEVTPEHLELWLKEARRKRRVTTEGDRVGGDVVARLGDDPVRLEELGEVLVRSCTTDEFDRFVKQIVLRRVLGIEARARDIRITAAQGRAEVARLKASVEGNPRFGGVPYAEILRSQGTTIDELATSPVTIANLQQRAILAAEHDDAGLTARLARDRQDIVDRLGPRRHLWILVVRARDEPNEFVRRDFAEAELEIGRALKRITDGMSFEDAARIHSDHGETKVRGGDAGMQPRIARGIPDAVLTEAFAATSNELLGPIRTDEGFWLVKVTEIEPMPDDAELKRRLRLDLSAKYRADLLERARIEIL